MPVFFLQTYEEWKDLLPDFSEYNWVIPDYIWELSEQIDLGRRVLSLIKNIFVLVLLLVLPRYYVTLLNLAVVWIMPIMC